MWFCIRKSSSSRYYLQNLKNQTTEDKKKSYSKKATEHIPRQFQGKSQYYKTVLFDRKYYSRVIVVIWNSHKKRI
jgi:polyphosphate kinase 2 (PPK2 family)